jgi:hypothetical protein
MRSVPTEFCVSDRALDAWSISGLSFEIPRLRDATLLYARDLAVLERQGSGDELVRAADSPPTELGSA